METKKPENPNAFPGEDAHSYHKGMTLRDYFAAKAMQGSLANNTIKKTDNNTLAAHFYSIADAMLKQRELNDENS